MSKDARHVRRALNVGVSAQGVHATAGASDISQQQLQHGRGADDLRAKAVLRPANGVNDGANLLGGAILADGGVQVRSLQELIFGNAGDALHHLRRVAGVLLLQQLVDAARMLQVEIVGDVGRQRRRRWAECRPLHVRSAAAAAAVYSPPVGGLTGQIAASFVIPRSLVVTVRGRIETGIQAVIRKLEAFFDDERGVGVIDQVLLGDPVVLQRVADDTAQEGNVGARTNLQKEVGLRCRAREARIDDDHFGVAVPLRLDRPLETARVILSRISTHDQHHVGVLDVDPAVGHRPAPESWSQT